MAARVERFCKTTRWFHGCVVGPFLTLASTGGALALRDELGLPEDAARGLVRIHEGAAVALLVLPAVVLLSGRTGETLRDFGHALRWSRADLRWLALQPLAAVGRAELPPAGKLNAGQKLNALASVALAAALAGSGAWLWLRPGALAPWFVHLAAFVLWIPAFAGHFFLAVIHPATRPALRGMVLGEVDRAWAEHHHPAWVAELPPASAPAAAPAPPAPPARAERAPRNAAAVDGAR